MPDSPEPNQLAQPIAYINGNYMPRSETRIPIWDLGFMMGASVTEHLRTFGGRLAFLGEHLDRMQHGLNITGLEKAIERGELEQVIEKIATENRELISRQSDLGIGIVITPGPRASMAEIDSLHNGPTVLVYSYELPLAKWAKDYEEGIRLTSVATRETPASVLPSELKCRSRMHYYLAEKEATEKDPGSHALLMDVDGNVAEATIASVAFIKDNSLVAPPESAVLPSVSFASSAEILRRTVPIERRHFSLDELIEADEVLWFNASRCVVPVTSVDRNKIADGKPGKMFHHLRAGWMFVAQADFVQQANELANMRND